MTNMNGDLIDASQVVEPASSSGVSISRRADYERRRAERKKVYEEEIEALRLEEAAELSGPAVPSTGKETDLKPDPGSKRPAMKDLSKAERRAIQEKQRAEKAVLKGTAPVATKQLAKPSAASTSAKAQVTHPKELGNVPATPLQLFMHLEPSASLETLSSSQHTNAHLHPSILRLAQLYAKFKIVGSNSRCIAMLEAFKEVIRSYTPPPGTSLSRHLPTHLSPQITHLVHARPLSVSMGNAIRHLKGVISRIGVDVPDEEAKKYLYDRIDLFVRDRIVVADKVIESHAITKIKDGDVIMTYANSSVIQGVLLEAHRQEIEFSVIVVDSRPMYEGKNLLRLLSKSGINCTYVLITSIGPILRTVDVLLLGTHALLGNGAMYGRAGTAMLAMMCKNYGIPVICCCETYKFSDRVMLDSIVSNEMSTPQAHLPPTSHYPAFDFVSTVPQPKKHHGIETTEPCKPAFQELAVLYDVSRPEDVTMVITEAGMIPVQSVPVLLRDYKPLMAE